MLPLQGSHNYHNNKYIHVAGKEVKFTRLGVMCKSSYCGLFKKLRKWQCTHQKKKKGFKPIVKSKDLSLMRRKKLFYFDTEKNLFYLHSKAEYDIAKLERRFPHFVLPSFIFT